MADIVHLRTLCEGPRTWNAWRARHPDIVPDLTGAQPTLAQRQLGPINGGPINLSRADLSRAVLYNATLTEADLDGAILVGADLTRARLEAASLVDADLRGAIFDDADLTLANLSGADLSGAELHGAQNLTQGQIDLALGDETTTLPPHLTRPERWLWLAAKRHAPVEEPPSADPGEDARGDDLPPSVLAASDASPNDGGAPPLEPVVQPDPVAAEPVEEDMRVPEPPEPARGDSRLPIAVASEATSMPAPSRRPAGVMLALVLIALTAAGGYWFVAPRFDHDAPPLRMARLPVAERVAPSAAEANVSPSFDGNRSPEAERVAAPEREAPPVETVVSDNAEAPAAPRPVAAEGADAPMVRAPSSAMEGGNLHLSRPILPADEPEGDTAMRTEPDGRSDIDASGPDADSAAVQEAPADEIAEETPEDKSTPLAASDPSPAPGDTVDEPPAPEDDVAAETAPEGDPPPLAAIDPEPVPGDTVDEPPAPENDVTAETAPEGDPPHLAVIDPKPVPGDIVDQAAVGADDAANASLEGELLPPAAIDPGPDAGEGSEQPVIPEDDVAAEAAPDGDPSPLAVADPKPAGKPASGPAPADDVPHHHPTDVAAAEDADNAGAEGRDEAAPANDRQSEDDAPSADRAHAAQEPELSPASEAEPSGTMRMAATEDTVDAGGHPAEGDPAAPAERQASRGDSAEIPAPAAAAETEEEDRQSAIPDLMELPPRRSDAGVPPVPSPAAPPEAPEPKAVSSARDADDAEWESASSRGTRGAILRYLRLHPKGRHVEAARDRLSALKLEAAWRAIEDDNWALARRLDTPESYVDYLSLHPSGRYVPQAKARIAELGGLHSPPAPEGSGDRFDNLWGAR